MVFQIQHLVRQSWKDSAAQSFSNVYDKTAKTVEPGAKRKRGFHPIFPDEWLWPDGGLI